ncbi:MAG: hypothetical protein LBQ05_02190 [Christensenellaceae bacterium]|nr:hypothetical protein [Christensenellaceae bacterium]
MSVLFTFTVFVGAFPTLGTSAKELWQSVVAYFYFVFTMRLPKQSPIETPTGDIPQILPETPTEFVENNNTFWQKFFDGNNLNLYFQSLSQTLIVVTQLLPFIVLMLWFIRQRIHNAFTQQNNDYNSDSKPLLIYKKISSKVYTPIKHEVIRFGEYLTTTQFLKLWLLIWCFNFNLFAVLLSFIGICLYFFISFSWTALYDFAYNTIERLMPMFRFIPSWAWVIIALVVINIIRRMIGRNTQRHLENKNKGFINDRSIVLMPVGTMGKGKTTLVTDMSLSQESIFRTKVNDGLTEIACMFYAFPFIVFERDMLWAIDNNIIFNLTTACEWVKEKQKNFEKNYARSVRKALKYGIDEETATNECQRYYLWTYDHWKYGLTFNNGKEIEKLFDCLEDYAKLYFMYIMECSFILSNYSQRTDFMKNDLGNFPVWDLDFFNRKSKNMDDNSRFCHILDFDMVRYGKKVVANNPLGNIFEYGIIAITEVGKERGNQFKLQDLKDEKKELKELITTLKKANKDFDNEQDKLEELTTKANQSNDKMNDFFKLIRHTATIRGVCYARVFMDEQRPESLGADARDLCEIIRIKDKSDTRLAMPFYFIEELLHAWLFPKYLSVKETYRFNRGDNTLFMYLITKLSCVLHNSYVRTYNEFGYYVRKLGIEDITGVIEKEVNYYLIYKKIYAKRFDTSAYANIFAEKLKKVKLGMRNIPEYKEVTANIDELISQHSYFVEDILKYMERSDND